MEDEHPGWNDNPELTDEYLHILKTITKMMIFQKNKYINI